MKIQDERSATGEQLVDTLLQYAMYAPSTHNSQPWKFKVEDSRVLFYADPQKRIPQADPEDRDRYISLGCAIENFIMAAKAYGVYESVSIHPSSDSAEVAAVSLSKQPATQKDEVVLEAIRTRRNARGIFKQRTPEQRLLDEIQQSIQQEIGASDVEISFIQKRSDIEQIGELTKEGIELAYQNPAFRKEMSGWMHSSISRSKEGLPGYALKMPFILSFIIPTAVRFFNLGKLLGVLNQKSLRSAPLVTVLSSHENNPAGWMTVGRVAVRMMVLLNKGGFHSSVFSAAVELGDLYKGIQRITGSTARPQLLFAIGEAESLHRPPPRHSVQEKKIQ